MSSGEVSPPPRLPANMLRHHLYGGYFGAFISLPLGEHDGIIDTRRGVFRTYSAIRTLPTITGI
jgi:hypothetical protein